MRIGILTFFETDNYGTVLQAYSLQKYLENCGHTVEFIHIYRDMIGGKNAQITPNFNVREKIRIKISTFLHRKDNLSKHIKFTEFRKNLRVTEKFYSMRDLSDYDWNDYDLYISGGDQIWNPNHKTFSYNYMFSFLPNDKKRISYASSFGQHISFNQEIKNNFYNYLSKYSALSVRESSGKDIIEMIGLKCRQVMDPVFLIKDEWLKAKRNISGRSKYCVVYAISEYERSIDFEIKEFARKNKLKIVVLPENRHNHLSNYKKKFDLSPDEFIELIANSNAVFTNSFHGAAFAILFNRQLFILPCKNEREQNRQIRLTELLNTVGIENNRKDFNVAAINYDIVDKKIDKLIEESKRFLNTAINKCVSDRVEKR